MSWIVISVALLACLLTAIDSEMGPLEWAINICSVAAILAVLRAEARRNLRQAFLYILPTAAVAIFLSAVLVSAQGVDERPFAAALGVVTVFAATCAVLALMRNDLGSVGDFPNYLLDLYEKKVVRETSGIQLVLAHSEGKLETDGIIWTQIVAQNGWSQPRTLHIRLRAERRVSLNSAGIRFPAECSIELPPAGAGAIWIPIGADIGASGQYSLEVAATATGEGGRKLRRWCAPAVPKDVPVLITLLALTAGGLLAGGGWKIKVQVTPGESASAPPLGPPETEVLFVPSRAETGAKWYES